MWTAYPSTFGQFTPSCAGHYGVAVTITVVLHEKGIKIKKGVLPLTDVLDIHYSQIIEMVQFTETELRDKSVLGRALVGHILFGGVGAIVGGISGTGSKKVRKYYLIINFWDKDTRQPCSLTIGTSGSLDKFLEKSKKMISQIQA